MQDLKESPEGYASPAQKNLLAALSRDPILGEAFFLTGGTALSVFYLGHRVSDDIDLFTSEPMDLPAITDLILQPWNEEITLIISEPSFVSVLIRNVKVDFVVDHLADIEIRPMAVFDSGGRLAVDSLEAIAGNKMATLISRLEPKDYIDFYIIARKPQAFKPGDEWHPERSQRSW
ncbi:MAG: nucleotidyl transferase AbiEii/AbiGii toxin family protein, partial [Acidobacteriota bacterium]|nr:nucleotidyl transferase AbiEii/AbiGii toxin family protein [Acidobacteriota bacterium]